MTSTITITKEVFGTLPASANGEPAITAHKYTFVRSKSVPIATVATYGAALLNFHCPTAYENAAQQDGEGTKLSSDIIVSYDTLEAFDAQPAGPYFGVTVGRYCNRIAKGKFGLKQPSSASGDNGQEAVEEYSLALNNGPNHLHGGPTGYHHRNWSAAVMASPAELAAHLSEHQLVATPAPAAGSVSGFDSTAIAYPCVIMWLTSEDGEEGYPAKLHVGCVFSVEHVVTKITTVDGSNNTAVISDEAAVHRLRVDHLAGIDAADKRSTVVNLTNHAYFNLAAVDTKGSSSAAVTDFPITDLHLALNADRFTPTDETAIPYGIMQPVTEVPAMDFVNRVPGVAKAGRSEGSYFGSDLVTSTAVGVVVGRRIGEAINDDATEQIRFGHGYDHNWCLNGGYKMSSSGGDAAVATGTMRLAAVLTDPKRSKRFLRVLTTQPGVQLYSGNFLDGTIVGKDGKLIPRRTGLCLETQHFPDSPNEKRFPSTTLKVGERYHHTTVFEVGTCAI